MFWNSLPIKIESLVQFFSISNLNWHHYSSECPNRYIQRHSRPFSQKGQPSQKHPLCDVLLPKPIFPNSKAPGFFPKNKVLWCRLAILWPPYKPLKHLLGWTTRSENRRCLGQWAAQGLNHAKWAATWPPFGHWARKSPTGHRPINHHEFHPFPRKGHLLATMQSHLVTLLVTSRHPVLVKIVCSMDRRKVMVKDKPSFTLKGTPFLFWLYTHFQPQVFFLRFALQSSQ